jgi:hypothetical protein
VGDTIVNGTVRWTPSFKLHCGGDRILPGLVDKDAVITMLADEEEELDPGGAARKPDQ